MRAGGMKMYSIRERIRRLLHAPCPLCGLMARGGDLCLACENEVRFDFDARLHCPRCLYQGVAMMRESMLKVQLCSACLLRPRTYARAIAGIYFAAPGDQLMRGFKAKGRLTEAGLFARLLWRNMQLASPRLPTLDALVPIPSSREAILQRGFNPAGEIARELASLSGVSLRGAWCRRTREASSQKTLNWRARQQSVRGLYEAQVPQACGWVGLVDDVLTTGSTLEEASGALLRAGAKGVVALVAARTLAK
jgi:predicted amidophosphoribosyltransferase